MPDLQRFPTNNKSIVARKNCRCVECRTQVTHVSFKFMLVHMSINFKLVNSFFVACPQEMTKMRPDEQNKTQFVKYLAPENLTSEENAFFRVNACFLP